MPSFLLVIAVSIALSAVGAAIVYRLGHRFGLMDTPHVRSSHRTPTPRGGGIGIWLAFLSGAVFVESYAVAITAGMVGITGFLDDWFDLSSEMRLVLQLIISATAVILLKPPVSVADLFIFPLWVIFITGTMNFYNFMDGINGIAGLTGLVGFGLMAYFSYFIANEPGLALISIVLASGCAGFLPFNFPRARVFLGDVGSVLLGFVFALFVLKFSKDIAVFLCLIMFLWPFYADAVVTVFYRLRRGENLMQAHRSHLYQYMTNELGLPHWKVSVLYATAQLASGVMALTVLRKGLLWQFTVFTGSGILFLCVYKAIKGER